MPGKFMLPLFIFLGLITANTAWGKVEGKEVEYRSGDVVLKGYVAEDTEAKGKRPGILVVHEWWGLNDYVRKRALMLAELGYTALAVDMYGNGRTAEHPDDAGKFAAETMKNKARVEARFNAALEFLRKLPTVDSARIAAIGYCFGGGVVLHMARQGADLKGVVSFHGTLSTDSPAKTGAVKAKILVFTGAADKMVPPEQAGKFVEEMVRAGVDLQFFSLPGARHSFTNPDADKSAKKFNLPLAYNREADERSWEKTRKFFEQIFR